MLSSSDRDAIAVLIGGRDRVVLELGCGPNKVAGRIGIDRLALPGVDIVADLSEGLSFLWDASVDEVHSSSFLEHVPDLEKVIREIVRVLRPGGRNFLFVPHFSSPFYYSDYTHRGFFGLYTFYYFSDRQERMRRKVPIFYGDVRIHVIEQKLRFYSSFAGIRFFKKLFERLVNSSGWMQEFYEENLCYLIPCYGIDVVFERADTNKGAANVGGRAI